MRNRGLRSGILILSLCLSEGISRGQSPSLPDWIWTPAERATEQTVYFRKEFSIAKRVVKAEICVATDFNSSLVFLDGETLGEAPSFSPPLRKEVTKPLTIGSHVVAVKSQGTLGPSALALQIEIEFED